MLKKFSHNKNKVEIESLAEKTRFSETQILEMKSRLEFNLLLIRISNMNNKFWENCKLKKRIE